MTQSEALLNSHIEELLAHKHYADFALTLMISGGLPAQSFHLNLHISGEAQIQGHLQDALSKRDIILENTSIGEAHIKSLLQHIIATGILEAPYVPPLFVPDTLIGSLTIKYKHWSYHALFHADETQAKSAKPADPIALRKLIKHVYVLAKDVFEISIDPNK